MAPKIDSRRISPLTETLVIGGEAARVPAPPTRRFVLRRVGAALVAAPLIPFVACDSGGSAGSSTDGGTGGTGGGTGTGTGGAGTAADGGTDGSSIPWATGGTASMRDKASYPNPFASGAPTACALTCAMTVGPCYSSQSEMIQDISYGKSGLPLRMVLQIVNESCQPVAGALVDVWHTGPGGVYSGNDAVNENVAFCTGNDADYTSHVYFRGKQVSDANGLVSFDTCFPGWYSGRTIHIHMTISVGGQAYVTTQLFFPDTLDDEIVGTQPLYDTRGARNTTNLTDTVITASALPDYLFQTQKMTDGAMLAWKTIVLRTSLSSAECSVAGSSGPGGGPADGGPPGFPG